MASPIYAPINDNEIESGDPITVSLGLRWAKNYLSVIQGSPSARAAGLGVWIAKTPGVGDPEQTGILTGETNTSLCLCPDGAGSVVWASRTNLLVYGVMNNTTGVLLYSPGNRPVHAVSMAVSGFTDQTPAQPPPGEIYTTTFFNGHHAYAISPTISPGAETALSGCGVSVQVPNALDGNDDPYPCGAKVWAYLFRKRAGVFTLIASDVKVGLTFITASASAQFIDIQAGDEYFGAWAVWVDQVGGSATITITTTSSIAAYIPFPP
jgi:hypothetical protein